MSDYLMRAFSAQLTTTMDLVVKRAVYEIIKIFENSLHDHQIELAQKGEEVVQLKIKLQTAELKLLERECEGDKGVEISKTQINETQEQPEDVLNLHGQSSDVPEIDFEVPDDWCAPLGCETVTKKDEVMCPSIRLRPLSIPLWHIPLIKKEVVNYRIDSHQQIRDIRRSKRVSLINEKERHIDDRSLHPDEQVTRRQALRNDKKKFYKDVKQECSGSLSFEQRGGKEKGQENMAKNRKKKRETAKIEPTKPETEKNVDGKKYTCKFCKKVFDTLFGRNVHTRSHKKCRGCRKDFDFPSALKSHKRSCKKLKALLAKEALHRNPPQYASSKEKPTEPSKKQVIVRKEQSHSWSSQSESLIQNDASTKLHCCPQCNKTFQTSCELEKHVRVHTDEKPFSCNLCPKKFHICMALKSHMTKMHKQLNSSEINGDLAWTKPLEDIECNPDNSISTSNKAAKRVVSKNLVQRESSPAWHKMGVRNLNGFNCSVCKKLVKTKRRLLEHYSTHTGERPIKCERCPAAFRTFSQLYIHKKRCRFPPVQIKCEKCEKIFCSQTKLNKHVFICQKSWPFVCKVCGKGFITEGPLWNHMKHFHS